MQCFVAYHHHKNFSNFLGASRGSVSLGAWFGFAFLVAVLCELCGKEELNREERQGFAKDAKQWCVGLALRSWWQFFASFAVKKNLTAKNAKDSQRMQSRSLSQGAN